ncbi:long-chain-fatty-acid--CoA ligase [Kineobactrum salinum]|uniref:Long-chain-fatty-acid--CoA ligase n=1 Tax=Kineobactrum salinum TaxID=2708301 RepID=A0A6C0U8K8_9GAMM|nr:long-chain-fatty-acid--CoA ligase [Kineobactrum salinum]QIB67397.1 long-chain-fatty-acid--CoA ligase [Kineobactrum salinum]
MSYQNNYGERIDENSAMVNRGVFNAGIGKVDPPNWCRLRWNDLAGRFNPMLMHDPFNFQAKSRGSSPFASCEGVSITYAEAHERTERLASIISEQGVRKGDRFCLLMRNSIDYILLIYAGSRIGAVPVTLNYRLAPPEWADTIADSESGLIVSDIEFCEAVDAGLSQLENAPAISRVSIGSGACNWHSLEDALNNTRSACRPVALHPDDAALQMYTSGTTGKPKGVVLSHRAFVSNITQSLFSMPYRLNPGERTLVVLPLFHIAAIATSFSAVSSGAMLVVHREVNPVAIANSLVHDEIVVASLVPAVIQLLLTGVPELEAMEFPKLAFVGYGASPIAEPVLRRAMEVFKCHFAQGYGMTELAGSCALLTEEDHRRALADDPGLLLSAGKALPGVQLRIVGSDEVDLPPGEVGEVLVRGPQLMSGYWRMSEETAETLRHGWLHTGDAGYLDAEGYLYIYDRIKDMIVSGAENIYPSEIESVLHRHPGIADASVIGVPDERWGETVMAIVVTKPGAALSEDELDRFCRKRLGAFKVPRKYTFVQSLPRNPAGKIVKKELRKKYWADQPRQVR